MSVSNTPHEPVESVAAAEAQVLVVPIPTLERWVELAHTLNGYALAEELGVDLGELSHRLRSGYWATGEWVGTLLELRMVLFHEARAIRFVGGLDEDPEYSAEVAALLNAIAVADDERRRAEPEPPAGAPEAFHAFIGGHFGPSFEVAWDRGRLKYNAYRAWRDFGLPEGTGPVTRFVRPTAQRWQRFWDVIDKVDAWNWEAEYSLPVMDGASWELVFEGMGRALRSRGSNAYPGTDGAEPSREFRRVCRAISRLVDGFPFR